MDCILSVDVGTQSLKACAVDLQYRIIEKQQIHYSPEVKKDNHVEIDTAVLWNAFVKACRGLRNCGNIRAVSFATLCPSIVPLDSKGNPLRPLILHLDRRSYRQARFVLDTIGEDTLLKITGNPPIPGGISLTSLLWIKENEPSIYNHKSVVFGHAITFFMKKLTGNFLIDPSNASFTGLYETVKYGDWSDTLLDSLEISKDKLPQVVPSTAIGGKINTESARETGLIEGTPVVIGANDTTCAAVGAGIQETGELMNTSGTVEIMVLSLKRPLVNKKHLLRTHAYPKTWLAMRTVGAGGASIEWFRKNICSEMTKEYFYSNYLIHILSSKKATKTHFYPYLSGDRHSVKNRSAAFTRISLDTTREDLLLALVNGIVNFQIEGIKEWKKYFNLKNRIYHVGGGAQKAYTDYKQRFFKDCTFIELKDTSLIGAAKLGFDALEQGEYK